MKKLPFIFLISIFLFSCRLEKKPLSESASDSLSAAEISGLSLSDAQDMILQLKEENRVLEETHQILFKYFVCLIATLVTGAAILVILNTRESKRKDKIIYNSEQFLQHSIRVQEAERKRISQELHDSVAQSLRYVSLLAENLDDKKTAAQIIQTQNNNIDSIRRLCYNLTPPAINGENLIPVINLLGQKLFDPEHTDFQFRVVCEPSVDFEKWNDDELLNIYRIIQEGLQNIQKHARASETTVLFRKGENDGLKIIVTDDGCGMDEKLLNQINSGFFENVEDMHFGLRNIFECVKFLKGSVAYFSEENAGTRIVLEIWK
ncbi:MAG: hypothetical protein J6S91_09975 [Treponema sp.]|nr:hypothetical protein [Treponema sp.]